MLANAPFRRLWTATSLCSLGDWLNIIALTALAAALTAGSGFQTQALAVGGVFAAKMLPPVLLGPLAGVLDGRLDRRVAMFAGDLLRAALVVSIFLIGTYTWLIVAAVLIECAALLRVPAKEAAVSGFVPEEQREEAGRLILLVTYGSAPVAAALFALLSLASDLGRALSPGFTTSSTDFALVVNAVLYLASAALIFTLKQISQLRPPGPAPSTLRDLLAGRRHIAGHRLVGALVLGMVGAFVAGGTVVGVAKIYTSSPVLGGGDAAYGMVFGAVFLGVALGMSFGPRILRELSRRRLFGLSIVMAGVLLAAVALIHNLAVVVVLALALGICAGIAWITGYSMIAVEMDDSVRGRTFSYIQAVARVVLLVVVIVASPLAGLLGSHNLRISATIGYRFDGSSLIMLGGALLTVVIGFVALRRTDDRAGVPVAVDLFAALRGKRFVEESGDEEPQGLFIAFEGGEGSGKTTQSRLLAIWLRDQGFDVVQTREPGSTKVGMRLRAILLDAAHQGLSARSEALLYAADRAEHVEKVIRPALGRGALVVCDRYVDSSLAYQGAGRELDPAHVARLNSWATGDLVPDLTVLIDVPPSIGLRRFASPADRIEAEPLEFHERVRREFRNLAAAAPERYLVVDGTLTQEEVSRLIQDRVRDILPDPVPQESEDATGTIPAIRD
ncbi:hypothetical protein Ssi02_49720 [Sinosporangium siamense]|uniref:Thymidylate kinase n=1 Tax=Sinosporangium siamense TaxID=1367973 RepID=A0A919V8Y8_9ACTN|nr:hypothetical protein Ssi02_49720 [Sinosporangium siamense]